MDLNYSTVRKGQNCIRQSTLGHWTLICNWNVNQYIDKGNKPFTTLICLLNIYEDDKSTESSLVSESFSESKVKTFVEKEARNVDLLNV